MFEAAAITIEFIDGVKRTGLGSGTLSNFELNQSFNDHARLTFTWSFKEDDQDQTINDQKKVYQHILEALPDLSVSCNKTCIFQGMTTRIALKQDPAYMIVVEAVSHTYSLDNCLHSRSFTDQKQYSKLVTAVADGCCQYHSPEPERAIDHFILQYQETDWQFLKRLASYFQIGLIANATSPKAYLYFGVPLRNSQTYSPQFLEPHKQVQEYLEVKETANFKNKKTGEVYNEEDFIEYHCLGGEIFNAGEELLINYNNVKRNFWVKEVRGTLVGSQLQFAYTLTPKDGLRQNTFHNPRIAGTALEGTVQGTEKSQVKVTLTLDGSGRTGGKASQFPYATFYTAAGNIGWYCMPEKGDSVMVYFPTSKEEDAIILTSFRKWKEGETKALDPKNKSFRSQNLEADLTPSAVNFSADASGKNKPVYVRLDRKSKPENLAAIRGTAITVEGNSDLTIKSTKQRVIVAAGKSVELTSDKGGQIILNNQQIQVKGETNYIKAGSQSQSEDTAVKSEPPKEYKRDPERLYAAALKSWPNPAWKSSVNVTHCNQFVAESFYFYTGSRQLMGMKADGQQYFMSHSKDWQRIYGYDAARQAQNKANQGYFAVAVTYDHIAEVMPKKKGEDDNEVNFENAHKHINYGFCPLVAQHGKHEIIDRQEATVHYTKNGKPATWTDTRWDMSWSWGSKAWKTVEFYYYNK